MGYLPTTYDTLLWMAINPCILHLHLSKCGCRKVHIRIAVHPAMEDVNPAVHVTQDLDDSKTTSLALVLTAFPSGSLKSQVDGLPQIRSHKDYQGIRYQPRRNNPSILSVHLSCDSLRLGTLLQWFGIYITPAPYDQLAIRSEHPRLRISLLASPSLY